MVNISNNVNMIEVISAEHYKIDNDHHMLEP